MGAPLIDTKVGLRYGHGLDIPKDILDNAINWGLVKASGARYVFPFDDKTLEYIEEIPEKKEDQENLAKAHGEENAREWLIQNPDQMNFLEKKLRETIFS